MARARLVAPSVASLVVDDHARRPGLDEKRRRQAHEIDRIAREMRSAHADDLTLRRARDDHELEMECRSVDLFCIDDENVVSAIR